MADSLLGVNLLLHVLYIDEFDKRITNIVPVSTLGHVVWQTLRPCQRQVVVWWDAELSSYTTG